MGAKRLVEGTTSPAFAITCGGRISAVNAPGAALVDREVAEILGSSCDEVFGAIDTDNGPACTAERCATLIALAAGRPVDSRWCRWHTTRTAADRHATASIAAHLIVVPPNERVDGVAAIVLIQPSQAAADTAYRDTLHDSGAHPPSDTPPPLTPIRIAPAPAQISLHLFGTPKVERDTHVIAIRRQRSYELLALLAFAGADGMRRDHICGLLWPETNTKNGRGHLRVLLHGLRQSLGADAVIRTAPISGANESLTLNSAIWTDVWAFEYEATALLRPTTDRASSVSEIPVAETWIEPPVGLASEDPHARLEHAAQVLALYRGDLGADSDFGEWALAERARLRAHYISLITSTIMLAAAAGAVTHAIDLCERAITIDPLHEGFRIALIAAYGRQGRHSDQLTQYRSYREMLASELSIRPSAAVERALRQTI